MVLANTVQLTQSIWVYGSITNLDAAACIGISQEPSRVVHTAWYASVAEAARDIRVLEKKTPTSWVGCWV
jgi:hypothetical protein